MLKGIYMPPSEYRWTPWKEVPAWNDKCLSQKEGGHIQRDCKGHERPF